MQYHYYLHSYDIDYSGGRNNNEQETYMLLQDTAIPDLDDQYNDIQEITEISNRALKTYEDMCPVSFFAFRKFK